ncbi:hypothetical protein CAXC1_220034 [Candidatus Xenohaliotis californiensis]|uniref:Uncharacterized protein n=1 Tax=Candidatus Xenohaliotis californiensis TaxID=84677 RepID=A0ABM9N7P9_9RICK|nr:hypothetical protein CAXC1_220034 [Candidatus Xenohaliotis californiensis]
MQINHNKKLKQQNTIATKQAVVVSNKTLLKYLYYKYCPKNGINYE